MSFNVAIATANHFGGLAAAAQREELMAGVVDEDARRKFWQSFMLPMLTESFLDSVINSPNHIMNFKIEGYDDPNKPASHAAVFQTFAHLCAPFKSIPARYVPWQFRFILHESIRDVLNTSHSTDKALSAEAFEKAGWYFWMTETGFCMYPKLQSDELSDISSMFSTWMKMRNEYVFTPQVSEVTETKKAAE